MTNADEKSFPGMERRKYPRIKGDMVEYAFYPSGPFKEPAFIKDLSIGGICLYVSEALGLDTILYLRIYISGREIMISAKGKVIWRGKAEGTQNYYAGIQFQEMKREDKDQLSKYITALVKEGKIVEE